MKKSELRTHYKKLRKKLSSKQMNDLSLQIANSVLELPIWKYSFFHVFLTIESLKEVLTEPILSILSGKDKHIVVSKSDFKTRTMSHVLLQDNTILKPNSWNIPEPENGIPISNEQIEVVFIPLVAFDVKGNRIGYGKGFYDEFLKNCSKDTLKIGLSFFEAEAAIDGIEPHDIPLDYCVTPEKIYTF
ncbi:5-formyltetrahydrofolate cyclo-ligase [Formosa sp. Hel1_33_131]|uniref:5-formyltetrahydrofolate cyclo-ligase n=1 Tax=Formosa sp. Hel1_33_131 TaxID=1336794 RepID=UPI00084E1687|nr:5-formyltetrahydrofolate cyclo-ligase [Formosa sp. Hel1_33_131]AOR28573.1 5-formyltetrahydrofolate cyclo-ligase [Formosa sp. Hel1_33_131]